MLETKQYPLQAGKIHSNYLIYMLMRVYHFINDQHGLLNLQMGRLKISTLNELNDPFELFGVEMSNESVRYAFQSMKTELSKSRGILCFSKSWSNPVMWSHYANRHAGLCLGFDIPDECLRKVSYSRKRLVAEAEKLSDPTRLTIRLTQKFLLTKYEHWKYEEEVRSFVALEDKDPETGLYFAGFSERLKLISVIVGANSSLSRSDIQMALSEHEENVDVFKARLAFKTFKVVRQKNELLWF